ncbi:MAG TPA: IS21 family transposase [Thermoanaerobaculia bacterium]|nr:IS21 family transposase [Thermoanaerobaculia bacterium]
MIDVKEVLRRWSAGQADRQIGRETGVDRKTVGRYTKAASSLALVRGDEVTDDVVHAVAQCVQARPVTPSSDAWNEVTQHRERVAAWLEGDRETRPLRLTKIHALLVRDHGLRASYDTLARFATQELGWRKKPSTVRVDDPPPGQEAQVDFGEMGRIVDAETGKRRTLWALIVTLSFSRYLFVWPTFRQTTQAVCEGLDRAWRFFGAMPISIIPDNTKAMIKEPDALDATLVAAFLDYVQARGLFVDPARVRSPKDKPRVENQVPFVRESWFDGEAFLDLEDARRSAETWCRDVAGARVHGTTRRVPREMFESAEKVHMKPAPDGDFDVPAWLQDVKVHPDHHIQVLHALYSVPHLYLRKHVDVRADKTSVKIYFGTELIKMHVRQPPGGRATDPADYPSEKAVYALRDVDALKAKAMEKGSHIGLYAERLLGGALPWTKMRQVYALLGLCQKFGDGRVEAICQSALAFDVLNVSRISRMLKSASKPPAPDDARAKVVQLPLPRFARPARAFETIDSSSKKKEGV